MRFFFVLGLIAASALFLPATIGAEAEDPLVTLVIHVPLQDNAHRPISEKLLTSYRQAFGRLGSVRENFGTGSWRATTSNGAKRLMLDPDDHVFITTRLSNARLFLRSFLPRLKMDMRQEATLAEILGGAFADGASENRIRFDLTFPLTSDCAGLRRAHEIFVRAHNDTGGASQYNDFDGIHVNSSIAAADASSVRRALKNAGLHWTESPSAFELVH